MAKPARVFILTYCRQMKLFYGTGLVFKTLRVGFPNARVTVVDNVSIPEAAAAVESLAKETDCAFERLSGRGVQHHEFIEEKLKATADDGSAGGPLVFLDPDICFWESCEDFEFDGILAGKQEGAFYCEATRTFTMPRIHTSFMWIRDAAELREEIERIGADHFDFEPFRSVSMKIAGRWYRFDTGGGLYAAIAEKVSVFEEEHLNRYDHLYGGCHVDWILPIMHTRAQELLASTHACARDGDLAGLKGIWRVQDEVAQGSQIRQAVAGKEKQKPWRMEKASVG